MNDAFSSDSIGIVEGKTMKKKTVVDKELDNFLKPVISRVKRCSHDVSNSLKYSAELFRKSSG